jgi:hypothetical protein
VLDTGTRPSAPEPDHYRAELEQVRDLLTRVAKGITTAGACHPLARHGFCPGQL